MSIKIDNELLRRYADSKCSPEEKVYVELWYNQYMKNRPSKLPCLDSLNATNKEIWNGIVAETRRKPNFNFSFLKVAAAVLVLVGVSFAVYRLNYVEQEDEVRVKPNFVSGKNQAAVMVASLRSEVSDELEVKNIMSALKADEQVAISTAVGEEYHAVLPDGSELWLNANSEVVIPSNYNKNYRDLQLKRGEAYFKVAKDKTRPFRVFAANTKIQALGTEFNVNYYGENNNIKAFLVEGSISISQQNDKAVIKPNQLYQIDDLSSDVKISEIKNPTAQYAWKSGYFEYSNTPLSEILEDLSRWYNFSFDISPKYKDKTLTGKISRKQPFSEVLAILEFSGIKYRKEGAHLTLIP